LREASWDEALDKVAGGFARIIAEHGPDAVALYVSGQLLTEDYYVANKFMKGYVGSANIDTNSRLCMSSAVAGHKRAFGEDIVPGCYEDFELADLMVLVGSNAAWCHPTLYQRIARAKEERPQMQVVVIDPRRTATCDLADLHLPVKPGTDVWLFNGLLGYLATQGTIDLGFVNTHTEGLADALDAAGKAGSILDVARPAASIRRCCSLLRAVRQDRKDVTAFTMGVNQSSSGADKVNAIINCHLITGRIGRPGMGPFSLTGQPNAMGGREVGGLANMLAAHMDLEIPAQRDRRAGVLGRAAHGRQAGPEGGRPVPRDRGGQDQGGVDHGHQSAGQPAGRRPGAARAGKCELVVASDIVPAPTPMRRPTCCCRRWAGARRTAPSPIPSAASRASAPSWPRRAVRAPTGTSSATWRGAWVSRASIYVAAPDLRRARAPIQLAERQRRPAPAPVRHRRPGRPDARRIRRARAGAMAGTRARRVDRRLFGDGGFAHTGRARFVPTAPRLPAPAGRRIPAGAEHRPRARPVAHHDAHRPLAQAGRARARTLHRPAPAGCAAVRREGGRTGARDQPLGRGGGARQHGGGIARGSVFMPIHWSGQTASDARVGAVVNPAVDPVSGEPEFKHTPVRIEPFGVAWFGFILSRGELALREAANWTRIQGREFVRYELAGRLPFSRSPDWARALLQVDDEDADWIEVEDKSGGVYRAVHLVDGRIEACLFVSQRQDLPARAWLAGMFGKSELDAADRLGLLSGRAKEKGADPGPTVCSCFGVGRKTIEIAIREQGCKDASQVTACTRAGGNCGSCLPEIRALLAATQVAEV
jgi:assimilatory nitrate reductase catalytic subunit